MRILNPYISTSKLPEEINGTQANNSVVENTAERRSTFTADSHEQEYPENGIGKELEVMSKKAESPASSKAFDHLQSQTLIEKARELNTKLQSSSPNIPPCFTKLKECLSSGMRCDHEIALVLRQ
eukprot:NODE_162_length_16547_cov_0.334326.p10 type:complete len:125 gc:universal NODE_162_length_16547_cov_0.334326:3609-3235(-)